MNKIRLHAIQTGRLVGNLRFLRANGWSGLLRRPEDLEFPVFSFLIEHPAGLVVVDTGLSPDVTSPRPYLQRRFVPNPIERRPLAQAMRSLGFDPGNVRQVVLTHLDWDHAGGLPDFPGAQVLVHRREWAFAQTRFGRTRFEPALWPTGFRPALYDFADEPYGTFAASLPITPEGELRIVPLPGHTAGHVGVVVRSHGTPILLCGDHVLRADWFAEDYAAGRSLGLGIWNPKAARDTSRRIHEFLVQESAFLVPSHDDESPGWVLEANQTHQLARDWENVG